MVPARARELFELWKDIVKKKKDKEFKFVSYEENKLSEQEILEMTADILKTQPEHIPKTISRFLKEIKESKES